MDDKVDQMVTEYVKPVKMIIKSEGKKSYKTTGPAFPDSLQIQDISYDVIIHD